MAQHELPYVVYICDAFKALASISISHMLIDEQS